MYQALTQYLFQQKSPASVITALSAFQEHLSGFVHKKHHRYDDISPELLYRNRVAKSRFFLLNLIASFTLNLFCMYAYFMQQLSGFAALNILMIYMGGLIIAGIIFLPYHPTHYGLNVRKLRFNLLIGTGLGGLGIAVAVGCRWYLVRIGHVEFAFSFRPAVFMRRFTLYLFLAPMQEIVFKGYIQSFLAAMFEGFRYRRCLAILIASSVFAQFHIIFGLPVVLLTFVFSCLTGGIYEWSRSCVGVSIIHFLVGAGFLFFSNAI